MTQNPPEAPADHPSDSGGHAGPDDGPRVTRDEIRDLRRELDAATAPTD